MDLDDQQQDPVLHTADLDQEMDEEQPAEGQEEDRGTEWDTDLETDVVISRRPKLSQTELYLSSCQRTGTAPVSTVLQKLAAACVNLNHYGLGPERVQALAIALENDSVLTNLQLEDNSLKAQGTQYLMEMLEENSVIQTLNLANNDLCLEGAIIVSKMLLDNRHITSLNLSGNKFDNRASKYFADALNGNLILNELNLSHNNFGDAAGEHLGQIIGTDCGLEVLDLSWNHISYSAPALSAGLKKNLYLLQLLLARNGLGPKEAESLGQALKQNKTLKLLDLTGNQIDDRGVRLLCQGLATNSTLNVLKLSDNYITWDGAITLLKTIKNNPVSAVREVDISSVFVREEFVELLEEVRQKRGRLDVQYSVTSSVSRNLDALQIFQKFLAERNETIVDFFQALDKEETMKVSSRAFRKAVKEAGVPVDQHQLEWLVRKFDKDFTANINYSHIAELV